MAKRVKVKDIAEKCGLSNTLVSLVLNDKAARHGIKPLTQEKVLLMARKMGYFQDQQPVQEKADDIPPRSIVGMIVPAFNNQFLFETGYLLDKAFSSIGMTFSMVSENENEQRFTLIMNDLKKLYSGVILYGDAAGDSLVRKLKSANYPFVVLEKKIDGHRVNEIGTNMPEACKLVADHILALGYKRIALIAQKHAPEGPLRPGLLIDTLHNTIPGLSISRLQVRANLLTAEIDPDEIIDALLPPDAAQLLIVENPAMVYPLLSLLKMKNIRVPADIALIAMDEGAGFSLLDPPVTRIRRNNPALALKTSQMLWTEVKNKGKSKYKRSVSVSPELIIGRSCGAV